MKHLLIEIQGIVTSSPMQQAEIFSKDKVNIIKKSL